MMTWDEIDAVLEQYPHSFENIDKSAECTDKLICDNTIFVVSSLCGDIWQDRATPLRYC